jgi:LemA protein
VDNQSRIDRMERDGILSADQADQLRGSIGNGGSDLDGNGQVGAGRRRMSGGWLILAAIVIAVAAGVVIVFGGGGGDTAVQDVTQTLNEPGGFGQMNRSLSTLLAIAVLVIIPLVLWVWMHNSLVSREEHVFNAWAQTESNFQRRADLIPALVDSVSRYLKHESETLTAVTAERAGATAGLAKAVDDVIRAQKESADIVAGRGEKIIEEQGALTALYQAQAAVGRSMTQLLAVVEDYPELRSSDQFLELQAQIEGTENRINVARMRFNEAVRAYNGAIRMLPASLVARAGNFQRKAYFRSEEEARNAPELGFE